MLWGCSTDFIDIKKSEIENAFILNSSPTFQGYYYLGSDESDHYFISKWKYGQDRRFKIKKNEMPVSKEETFGQVEIRIYEFKPKDSEIEFFCKAGNFELYRENNSN